MYFLPAVILAKNRPGDEARNKVEKKLIEKSASHEEYY